MRRLAGLPEGYGATEAPAKVRAEAKVAPDLMAAVERSGIESGMTISFHHHLRNGDAVVRQVLAALEGMGLRDLTLAPSSLPDSADFVADFVRRGVVSRISSSGLRGAVGNLVSAGEMAEPVVIRTHGGRARALEEGSLPVDVAFLGAPCCDVMGNFTGVEGPSACGSLGYAQVDARCAKHVIAVTDHLVTRPLSPKVSVPQFRVDQVVEVPSLGDPSRIATGAARITRNPLDLRIAKNAFDLIVASGLLAPGCSFQVGAGGASLAVAAFVRDYMRQKGIRGGFGLGGITGFMASMLGEGLFETLYDVQSFDAAVTASMRCNPGHVEIDASWYANPKNKGCLVNDLDVVVLAALEVDVDFNVNVLTGHDGVLRGASGGHADTAAGAKLAVVVLPSFRGGVPSVKDRVTTIVTPGSTVDAIVTERGLCINPAREDLRQAACRAGLPVRDIADLQRDVERLTGKPKPPQFDESRVVALVEYRDGTILDVVHRALRNDGE